MRTKVEHGVIAPLNIFDVQEKKTKNLIEFCFFNKFFRLTWYSVYSTKRSENSDGTYGTQILSLVIQQLKSPKKNIVFNY